MTDLLKVHKATPSRRTVVEQTRYRLYLNDLRMDFGQACGYCADEDILADPSTFHIDHFAPKRHFPALELAYANLVYACRFCNISKSDHWIGSDPTVPNNGSEGFVDPCSGNYDDHVGRDPGGRIVGKTALGRYIVRRLRLDLIRHELLWRARKARALRDDIEALIEEYRARGRPTPEYASLLVRFYDLTKSIEDYEFRAVPR